MPPNRPKLAELLKADPQNPNVRVQQCIDAFQNALEIYGCEVQVSIHFANGQANPEIRIVPVQTPPVKIN